MYAYENCDMLQLDCLPGVSITRVIPLRIPPPPHHSTAPSYILLEGVLSDDLDTAVWIKFMFRNPIHEIDNSARLELCIRQQLSLNSTVIPELIKCCDTYDLASTLGGMSDHGLSRDILQQMNELRKRDHINSKNFCYGTFMVTKRLPGLILADLYATLRRDDHSHMVDILLFDMLYQIANFLLQCQSVGVMINTLDDSTVHISPLVEPQMIHSVESGLPSRRIHYAVTILNFQHAGKLPTLADARNFTNTLLTSSLRHRDAGQTNEFVQNRDWFTLLYSLWSNAGIPRIVHLITRMVSRDALAAFSRSASTSDKSWHFNPFVPFPVTEMPRLGYLRYQMVSPRKFLDIIHDDSSKDLDSSSSVSSPKRKQQSHRHDDCDFEYAREHVDVSDDSDDSDDTPRKRHCIGSDAAVEISVIGTRSDPPPLPKMSAAEYMKSLEKNRSDTVPISDIVNHCIEKNDTFPTFDRLYCIHGDEDDDNVSDFVWHLPIMDDEFNFTAFSIDEKDLVEAPKEDHVASPYNCTIMINLDDVIVPPPPLPTWYDNDVTSSQKVTNVPKSCLTQVKRYKDTPLNRASGRVGAIYGTMPKIKMVCHDVL